MVKIFKKYLVFDFGHFNKLILDPLQNLICYVIISNWFFISKALIISTFSDIEKDANILLEYN